MLIDDPMERIIAAALDDADIPFVPGESTPERLDFFLPVQNIHIEVKQFHSDRIAEQMSRADNVIAVQGRAAVNLLADAIRGSRLQATS